MKMYGKAESVAKRILESFEQGTIPKALSQVFIRRKDNIPCRAWSWSNQLQVAFSGTNDARGFKQWKEAGRKVKKGCHAFHILAPCIAKKENENGEKESFLYGFRTIPVFRLEDTEIIDFEQWKKCSGVDENAESFLRNLPLRKVADFWGLSVQSYNGKKHSALGEYKHGKAIALGVENLSTWAHELTHAADDRNGTLVKAHGQNAGNEIVAELGGAVLLQILGYNRDADLGGCLECIKSYSQGNKGKALSKCMSLIKRTCDAVSLILETAESLSIVTIAA